MTEKIIIAGSGGQGVMLLGKIIAEAGMREGRFVTWLPAYGAEVRGGTANCMVIVSDEEIGSPFISEADTAIIFNEPSFNRFKGQVKDKGRILVNSSLVAETSGTRARVARVPFTETAFKLGSIKAANMVALGAFVALSRLLKQETVLNVLGDVGSKARPELLKLNIAAFQEGLKLIK